MNKSNPVFSKHKKIFFGPEIISKLISTDYPMIMVDKVTEFDSSNLTLSAERYISANEPVFIGHFPEFKLWPGIYTIEGLSQCCNIFKMLVEVDEKELLPDLIELQKLFMLKPYVDITLHRKILDLLENANTKNPKKYKIRVKLLNPVFAGCLMKYRIKLIKGNPTKWMVTSTVEGKVVAEGEITHT